MIAFMKQLPLVQRMMASAERGLHKSLAALRQLQKDRGFVPQNSPAPLKSVPAGEPPASSFAAPAPAHEIGFVPQNPEIDLSNRPLAPNGGQTTHS